MAYLFVWINYRNQLVTVIGMKVYDAHVLTSGLIDLYISQVRQHSNVLRQSSNHTQ